MNLNKVYLIGRLASDPEFRTTPSGQEVASLRMVTNRIWNGQDGQRNESSEFHNVVVWGRLAQIANQYLNKGSMVMIEGRLQTRSWEGQDGVKRYRTEVVAESLQLGPKPKREGMQDEKINKPPYAKASEGKEEIPVVNESEPPRSFVNSESEPPTSQGGPSDSEIEEDQVQLKDVPF
jgi:single-strand DNA-binding protein